MGYLGATLTQVFARVRGADVSIRDVTIETRDGKRGYRVRMMSRTGSARRILGILKKSVSWVVSCLGRRQLTFACSQRPWAGVARDGWGRWKSQNRKNVYLSPYVEVFFVFRDSYVLCIYVMNILTYVSQHSPIMAI